MNLLTATIEEKTCLGCVTRSNNSRKDKSKKGKIPSIYVASYTWNILYIQTADLCRKTTSDNSIIGT